MFQICFGRGRVSMVESCCRVKEIAIQGSRSKFEKLVADGLERSPVAPLCSARTERRPSLFESWLEAHGRAPFAFGLRYIPFPVERAPELIMSEGNVGRELYGFSERCDALVEMSLFELNLPKKKKRLCVVWGLVQNFVREPRCIIGPMVDNQELDVCFLDLGLTSMLGRESSKFR